MALSNQTLGQNRLRQSFCHKYTIIVNFLVKALLTSPENLQPVNFGKRLIK